MPHLLPEDKDLECKKVEKYYIVNGKITRTEYSYTDEYLSYKYRQYL